MFGYSTLLGLCLCVAMIDAGWHRVWEDNFDWDGGVDLNKWSFQVGGDGWGNNEQQFYTDNRRENARCEKFHNSANGRLIIEARREHYGNRGYTSARLRSKGSWTYGRLQIRAKLPAGRGLWPALWLLPDRATHSSTYWPDNGEIDLLEQVGFDPHRIHSNIHTKDNNHIIGNPIGHSVVVNDAVSNFKIYTLEWSPDKIETFVGDEQNPLATRILLATKQGGWTKWPFDHPFHVILNIAVGGNWGGQKGIDDGVFPARMEVDWVYFYQWR